MKKNIITMILAIVLFTTFSAHAAPIGPDAVGVGGLLVDTLLMLFKKDQPKTKSANVMQVDIRNYDYVTPQMKTDVIKKFAKPSKGLPNGLKIDDEWKFMENTPINNYLLTLHKIKINDDQPGAMLLVLTPKIDEPGKILMLRHICFDSNGLPKMGEALLQNEPQKLQYFRDVLLQFKLDIGPLPTQTVEDSPQTATPSKEENPLDILKKRYAKGEISKDEFEKMKEDLK